MRDVFCCFNSVFFVVIGIALSGCGSVVSYHQIRQAALAVNANDGIDKQEAVILAKNFIINKGLDGRLHSLKPLDVKERTTWDKDGETIEFVTDPPETFQGKINKSWMVFFRDKEGSFLKGLYPIMPFYVEIDRRTGEILGWGLKK